MDGLYTWEEQFLPIGLSYFGIVLLVNVLVSGLPGYAQSSSTSFPEPTNQTSQGETADTDQVTEATTIFKVNGGLANPSAYQAAQLIRQGVVLLRDNKNVEAAEIFQQAVKIDPTSAVAHHDYGLALAKSGRMSEAISEMQETLSLDSTIDSAWIALGGFYQSLGQIKQALLAYRGFLERFPSSPQVPGIKQLVAGLQSESRRQSAAGTAESALAPDYLDEVDHTKIRWPVSLMPIKVFIVNGEGTSGWLPQFARILQQSFVDWSNMSNGLVSFAFVPDESSAQIVCSWVADPALFVNSAEAGESKITSNQHGIKYATIKLLTVPQSAQLPLTENRFHRICLHEIGHVLGLEGHTDDPADAMFFSVTMDDQYHNLSLRDGNTIRKLYSN